MGVANEAAWRILVTVDYQGLQSIRSFIVAKEMIFINSIAESMRALGTGWVNIVAWLADLDFVLLIFGNMTVNGSIAFWTLIKALSQILGKYLKLSFTLIAHD